MSWLLPMLTSSTLAGPPGADLDGLAARADLALVGPMGCFAGSGRASWEHQAGRWTHSGDAEIDGRFDHRVWRVDRFDASSEHHDPPALREERTRLAPMLLGTSSASPLAYWETRRRWFEWPAPIVTVPMRSWGDVGTVSVDELAEGGRTVVQGFDWRGYKRATGSRTVELDRDLVPRRVVLDVTERMPGGCTSRATGEASLDAAGLPLTEAWTFETRCPLRSWTHRWTFTWTTWSQCERSG